MRAALFNGPKDITVGERADPAVQAPTDAVVRVVLACVCGSDLWYYRGESDHAVGPIGHEFIGVVEDTGREVTGITRGDLVVAPFIFSDMSRVIQNSTVKIANGPLTCANAGRRDADKGLLNNPRRVRTA